MATPKAPAVLLFAAYAGGFHALALARWVDLTFGSPTVDQLAYHLYFADGAAMDMSGIFLWTFLAEVLAFPLLLAGGAAWLHTRVRARWPARTRALRATAPAVAVAGLTALLLQFSVFSYAAAHFGPDAFGEAFVEPASVQLRGTGARNLVLIYVESLEDAYGDPALFGTDLLAPLRTVGGHSFEAYHPAEGTTWTIAGMVATQCGVPLRVYSEQDLKARTGGRAFLPGATCLADLLQEQGYRSVFLGGAPLSFAGKGTFLRDHGYAEALGREEWEQASASPQEMNQWGLYDDALFARARERLDALHASGQRFNLTLLTLDTHNPFGFFSPGCRARGVRDFQGIVHCTATQVAEFVEYARGRGYLKDTLIVILGDHLAVPNPAYAKLRQAPRRTTFNLFVGDTLAAPNTRELLPFDLYPTLVESLGFEVPGNRLGLGYSAVGPLAASPVPSVSQRKSHSPVGSGTYARLWRGRPAAD